MKTLPVAVQVYSVRDDAASDFAGAMKKLKEIGYDGVELAGLYGLSPAQMRRLASSSLPSPISWRRTAPVERSLRAM